MFKSFQLRIYYGSKATSKIIETPKYQGYNSILSSVGGAISLYLGMSFVSLCEFIEFALRALAACIGKNRNKNL